MVEVSRLVLSGGIIYNDVQIYSHGEPGGIYIPGLFERYQLFIKSDVVTATINMNMVDIIQIRREEPKDYMVRTRRLVMGGQKSFGPAWLIPEKRYDELNIPFLFQYDYKKIEHCAFIADRWLYLTKDEIIISVEH